MHLNVGSKMVLPIVALVVAVPALFALRLAWGSFSGADNRICYINAKGEPLVPAYKYSSFDAGYAPKIRVDGKIYTTPSAKQKGLAAELSGHTFGTRNGDLFQMWRYSAEKLADNRILVCGVAITQEQQEEIVDSSWLFDPVKKDLVDGPKLHHKCCAPSLTTLKDHRILVSGGYTTSMSNPVNYLEIYDPKTNTFTDLGEMIKARAEHSCIQIDDDHVLLVGGESTPEQHSNRGNLTGTTELLNLKTGKCALAGTISPRTRAILLNDGPNKVLIIGGWYKTVIMGDSRWVFGAETFEPKREAYL